MNPESAKARGMGLTLRTALWSWVVTVVTVLIFATAIIPQQKLTFEEHLRSKAHSVAVSLRDVAASAVVNEDYGAVVDHCKEVLRGDPALDYLVITKNDGFCLVNERSGWHTNVAGAEWRPVKREESGGFGVAPLFNRRVYLLALPFDYSGIEWGWIHVGLSRDGYDSSVAAVYRQTGRVAVGCMVLSLVASAIYARRLVRPVLSLRNVVQRVAGGDLAVRAPVERGDEIGTLAGSVNLMTEALLRRDQILQSVRFAAQQFLGTPDWNSVVPSILAKIGEAADVCRASVWENRALAGEHLMAFQHFEWRRTWEAGRPAATGAGLRCDYAQAPCLDWRPVLEAGGIVAGGGPDAPPEIPPLPAGRSILSLILIPIHVERVWWGFLRLDDCQHERDWTEAEKDSLRAAADMLGATIARQRAQDALVESKENLEHRVLERTRELVEQVGAKEAALAELAEAQQRLIEASRQAGMAEVATGVLHNVGNVLNSVNVSANLVIESVRESKVTGLAKLAALLGEQAGDLGRFVAEDPRGRQIPTYVGALAENLLNERTRVLGELDGLRKHVDHIKEIVVMQQSYAKVSGVIETVPASQLVDDALHLNAGALVRHGVSVCREFEPVADIAVEKHKVLQILVNLIRNAKYALDEGAPARKLLRVRVAPAGPERIRIEVVDNGVGIAPENLTRIFQHGFTTRDHGHGFGLHSGALAAKELGGSLTAHSDGLGAGARFSLELPLARRSPTGRAAVTATALTAPAVLSAPVRSTPPSAAKNPTA